MTRPRRHTSWRPLRRRLCAALTLVAYLAAALGVPLPASAAPKDASRPFPCQGHACGCRTAEQCWTSCCCFTPEQHWAWAEANHVRPPGYAERPAARCAPGPRGTTSHSWRTTRLRDRAAGQPAPSSCCQTAPQPTEPEPAQPAKKAGRPSRGGVSWGLGVAALKCRGLSNLWANTGAAPPPERPLTWHPYLTCVGAVAPAVESPLILPFCPPDPPPRPCCA